MNKPAAVPKKSIAAELVAAEAKRRPGRPKGSRNKPKEPKKVERLGYRLDEFGHAIGMSRAAIRRLIREGKIKAVRISNTPIIPYTEAQRLLTPHP